MILKTYNPRTPSQRFLSRCFFKKHKSLILKKLIVGTKNSSGRNNQGRITVFCRGGGHKKKYRFINFENNSMFLGIVTNIEYDPNRTSYIMSVFDIKLKKYFYTLAPFNIKIGNLIKYAIKADVKLGNRLQLKNIPLGCLIHNITSKTGEKLSRSAGSFSVIKEKTMKYCKVKITSGAFKILSLNSYGTVGVVSNLQNSLTTVGKAGRNRWLNKRPKVRGVAMNPIDHPHGGGEGKTSGGRPSVTPWGKPTRNVFTKKRNKQNYFKNG